MKIKFANKPKPKDSMETMIKKAVDEAVKEKMKTPLVGLEQKNEVNESVINELDSIIGESKTTNGVKIKDNKQVKIETTDKPKRKPGRPKKQTN